jgi:hypothetical protein
LLQRGDEVIIVWVVNVDDECWFVAIVHLDCYGCCVAEG